VTVAIEERDVTVHQGHVLEQMAALPAESVHCIVTSPPYYGLRDYGVDGQIGLEETPADYVAAILAVAAACARVLRPDGTLWLNLGDSYSGKANAGASFDRHRGHGHRAGVVAAQVNTTGFAPYKSLMGLPWRVALAMMDDGWTLRNDIVWHKPNAMPESVVDRFSCRYEHVFLFARSRRYRFDLEAVKISASQRPGGNTDESRQAYAAGPGTEQGFRRFGGNPGSTLADAFETRNPGDVWSIPTRPFPGAHFATMPPAVARRCILAGSPEGGVVLDPFAGSGTTLMVARQCGRRAVGIELNPEYIDIIRERIGAPTLEFGEPA
jgi:DNA modification methylase